MGTLLRLVRLLTKIWVIVKGPEKCSSRKTYAREQHMIASSDKEERFSAKLSRLWKRRKVIYSKIVYYVPSVKDDSFKYLDFRIFSKDIFFIPELLQNANQNLSFSITLGRVQ